LSEKEKYKYVQYIPRTKEAPKGIIPEKVNEIKEYLLKQHGVRVRDALEVVNQRKITVERKAPPKV